jgi:hypothetical protein
MRLIAVPSGLARYNREILTRDVIMVPELFCKPADLAIYDKVRKQETVISFFRHCLRSQRPRDTVESEGRQMKQWV